MPITTQTLADLERLQEAARNARSAYLFAYCSALFRRLGALLRLSTVKRAIRPA